MQPQREKGNLYRLKYSRPPRYSGYSVTMPGIQITAIGLGRGYKGKEVSDIHAGLHEPTSRFMSGAAAANFMLRDRQSTFLETARYDHLIPAIDQLIFEKERYYFDQYLRVAEYTQPLAIRNRYSR